MGVAESLGAVVKAFPQARLVAFADLSSRMILSSAGSLATTQEHLDRLCDQARAMITRGARLPTPTEARVFFEQNFDAAPAETADGRPGLLTA